MMKKVFALAMSGVIAFALTAYADTGKAPDYSQKASWHNFPEITKDVDTFYIYSTCYILSSFEDGAPEYAPLDNSEMLEEAAGEFIGNATAFADSTNVFMPYYRQAGMPAMKKAWKETGNCEAAIAGTPYEDITAALDYYFENCNNGRPFIFAGHSQGSCIAKYALKNYFKEHPEYYERMIAAYVIGYSVTKDEIAANPHMKFATGESDTGVIISWNTEGKKNAEDNVQTAVLLPGAININPLNWKLDDTYAPASENLGSLVENKETGEPEIKDVGADAQINLARGVVVTNAQAEPMPEDAAKIVFEFFGPDGRHANDYTLYYSNIKANAAKRIATYKANRSATNQTPDYSRPSSWCKLPEITKDIDTFYINSTVYVMDSFKDGASDYATLDNEEMLAGFEEEYLSHATTYEESTNVFMPYYRQAGLRYAGEIRKKTGNADAAISGMPYNDITAALDYYFEHYNNGRPFIIAGHSQGSMIAFFVLKKYFREHPEYYKRMVAAYVIGYSVTREDLADNPHLKFAAGESDTGVIISWNTEGPKNIETNASNVVVLPGAISINPLNWKLDETYAPASENLGSLVMNEKTGSYEIGDIGADAQINLARGVVVTNAKTEAIPEEAAKIFAEFFGPDGRHNNDYTYYYNNIKANVAKRVASYKAREKAPDYSQSTSWHKIPAITKEVDTFFIYPTEYMGFNEDDPDYAPLGNPEMVGGVQADYILNAAVYDDSTNVFMPFYRQAGMLTMKRAWRETGDCEAAVAGIPYSDITSALDYYFTHYNSGRPFILAGHSQGSNIAKLALKNYFKEHPDYYKRMIAAYIIGYSVTKDDLEANPHMKFATGETDTGVIISWNTEGRKNVEENTQTAVLLPGAISINPLNWKLDDTYAPASENLGSLVVNEEAQTVAIGDVGADAQVVPERGTVVTNAAAAPMPEDFIKVATEYFGPDGRHASDYTYYYSNIKDNVAKRIASYKAR